MPMRGSLAKADFCAEPELEVREDRPAPIARPATRPASRKDYFVERNGLQFAGSHLLADFWGACGLDDKVLIETALRDAVEACGATLLHIHLHRFTGNGGISGVAVLAESHISIHTWPERGFAALDIFMCGACDPYLALPVLRRHFKPETVQLSENKRGLVG